MRQLDTHDHRRDTAGYTYVYPVISRRAGGVSVGINLNPNNACNWACLYCQVPNLVRGSAPRIDLTRLEEELRGFLARAVQGDWLTRSVPENARRLQDIAFSGNGEPTSAKEFPAAVVLVGKVLQDFKLCGTLKLRLITNGSMMQRKAVLDAMKQMSQLNGEVWFKFDRATSAGMSEVNGVEVGIAGVRRRLQACATLCPTWVQTCWFERDGLPPAESEVQAYLSFMQEFRGLVRGVHLYGIARPPMQPGAERLSALAPGALAAYGNRIRALGLEVTVNP